MKIAFVGNQDNNAYRICKWVRQRGHDAHLYLINEDQTARCKPEYVDVELSADRGGYPDWIRPWDDAGRTWWLRGSRLARTLPGQYDAIVTSGVRGLLAVNQLPPAPIVHLVLGSELNDFPLRLFSFRHSPAFWPLAFYLRRALRKVRRLVTLGFWPEMRALRRLGLADKAMVWGFPEDPEGNRGRVDATLLAELNARYAGFDRVFLWFSRLNYLDPSIPEYKAADRFAEALARLVHRDGAANVRAIVGDHGIDAEAFHGLVRELKLDDYVEFVPHLPFWKMLTYARIANAALVAEPELEHGHVIGGTIREVMCMGVAVVSAYDEEVMRLCYGDGCPILRAVDTDSCHAAMLKLARMAPAEFAALADAHGQWAARCLHYGPHVDRLLDAVRETAYCRRFGPRP